MDDNVKKEGIYRESDWEAIIEAVLFTMGRSVEIKQLAVAIDQDEKTARAAVEKLAARYDKQKGGMKIIELEDAFQMCTRAEFYENLIRVASAPKKQVLTEVVLETLSIIAYKQPVTKMEISKIRGVTSDHAVNRLVEYGLVYEVGRLDAPGRPALFATTEEFLRRFGVGSKTDLPTMNPEQEEEIKAEVQEELQLRLGDSQSVEGEEAAPEAAEGEEAAPEAAEGEEAAPEAAEGEDAASETAEGEDAAPETSEWPLDAPEP
ncbi:SMC-Scp complex subunit ScpB [Clostridium sp. MCC353]|uniref:SMC-Scp complex subunit ScpB n=1 Tax=Clostridium sp. MCC353 TaxID=2592646 RepID=UPI001C0122B8|nr:SMC-Scp complex subunit ScpB [Clostridium sp. MCC353]MBT9774985.1 SMC-Scp complex subunit ScpB [Clostridium sp. MCC353]